MKLVPCPGCTRHIRSDERACPFCDQAVSFTCEGPCHEGKPAMSRAAVVFLGANALLACGAYGPPPPGWKAQVERDNALRDAAAQVDDDASVPDAGEKK